MDSSSLPMYLLDRSFVDVDDLTEEAKQWDLDFRQLDRGPFCGHVLQFGVGGVHISEARFCRSLRQMGAPPAGMRTIALPASARLRLEWRGKAVTGNSLMVFPKAGERLLAAISQAEGRCPDIAKQKRILMVSRAESYIEQYSTDSIEVSDVCLAAGVSERTLRYAFTERFGIGPKEYLQGFRLSKVRRQLRAADPMTTKVADLANAWGFWHMGQFAADYRRRFNELPSDTLRREGTDSLMRTNKS